MAKEKQQPRGIRNHNPGNLRKNDDPWQGLAAVQDDPEFFKFKSAVYGIRALMRTLITYQDKRKLRTMRQFIERWAPPNENDTTKYIADMRVWTHLTPDERLDMHDADTLKQMTVGIIWKENGVQPYTDAQLDKALTLAGVEPMQKSKLKGSRTINGQTAVATGTGGAAISEVIQNGTDALSPLVDYLEIAKWLFLGLILAGIGVTVYARWDDARRLFR